MHTMITGVVLSAIALTQETRTESTLDLVQYSSKLPTAEQMLCWVNRTIHARLPWL